MVNVVTVGNNDCVLWNVHLIVHKVLGRIMGCSHPKRRVHTLHLRKCETQSARCVHVQHILLWWWRVYTGGAVHLWLMANNLGWLLYQAWCAPWPGHQGMTKWGRGTTEWCRKSISEELINWVVNLKGWTPPRVNTKSILVYKSSQSSFSFSCVKSSVFTRQSGTSSPTSIRALTRIIMAP